MGKIRRLDNDLINMIAAGEVVERPASVVKELVENAIDAGATRITVALRGGGLEEIAITDDGEGMTREDACLAVERHATSKISNAADLFQIATLGFRGEALPSIASVSHFELTTMRADARVATRVVLHGGGTPEVTEVAAVPGTRIVVGDLFFNTPARRKFMKQAGIERKHAVEAVVRIALSAPQVAFRVEHEGQVEFSSPATADLKERIAHALSDDVFPHLVEVNERRLGLVVRGFVARPDYTLSTLRGLYAFVNGRAVRDRTVTFAVQRGFRDALPHGRQPVAVLFLELDPAAVDVNVHPQKLEVRFGDARGVQEVLVSAVERALAARPGPSAGGESPSGAPSPWYADAVNRFLEQRELPSSREPRPEGGLAFGQARPGVNEAFPPGFFASLRLLGPLGTRFWVARTPDHTLVVIDARGALAQVAYHALCSPRPADGALFSVTVTLEAKLAARLLHSRDAFAAYGLALEPFGANAVRLSGPAPFLDERGTAQAVVELAAASPATGALTGRQVALALAKRAGEHAVADADARKFSTACAHLEAIDLVASPVAQRVVVQQLTLLELTRLAD